MGDPATMNRSMAGVPRSFAELSQQIESRERELREFRDLRVGQLEILVEERDQLLLEANRRFEKLKDDFEYNLALIKARDVEIERLEHELTGCVGELGQCREEIKALNAQLESSHARETETQKKAELDRINNKRILEDFKEEIQQTCWAAEEDARARAREVDTLKSDIRRLNALRDESLETQRRDLTATFESLLQQREDSFAAKEKEIAGQITLLETRFESLQTENTRLKNDLAASLRKRESLAEELAQKEEARRQLQWTLEDERAARSQAESTHAHQLQQVTLELSLHKENAGNDVAELKKKLAMSKEDTAREKEFRMALEQRAEEIRRAAQQDLGTLEAEIAECRGLEGRQQREISALREERDLAQQRACSLKIECDALDVRLHTITVDYEGLAEELKGSRLRAQQSEAQLAMLQREFEDFRCQAGSHEASALQSVTQQLVESKTQQLQELTQLRRAHAEEVARLKAELELGAAKKAQESSHRQEGDMLEVQRRLADRESELEINKSALRKLTAELEEERRESAALKLRMTVYEAQTLKQQQQIKELERMAGTAGQYGQSRFGSGQFPGQAHGNAGGGRLPDLQVSDSPDATLREAGGLEYLQSPMFSEDLGPASLPNSPMASYPRGYPQGLGMYRTGDLVTSAESQDYRDPRQQHDREAFGVWGESKTAGHTAAARQHTGLAQEVGRGVSAEEDRRLAALAEENERLKRAVKEMRTEVEQLHSELELNRSGLSSPAKPVDTNENEEDNLDRTRNTNSNMSAAMRSSASSLDQVDREKFGLLEARLQQSMEEVRRLRNERSSVMDASNKIRSMITKRVVSEDEPLDDARAAELLSEVDHVQSWLVSTADRAAPVRDPRPGYEFASDAGDFFSGDSYAVQNSERYRWELEREQARRRQDEEELRQRRHHQRFTSRSREGGMSTAALLGEDSSDRSERPPGRKHYAASSTASHRRDQRAESPDDREDRGAEDSAGRRVWASPACRREGSKIPSPVGDSAHRHARSAGAARPSNSNMKATPAEAGGFAMKQSARQEMQMLGQSVGAPAPPPPSAHLSSHGLGLDSADALGFSASIGGPTGAGNLLSTASSMLPKTTNSGRTTPSQMDALRRIQESKRKNSMHVGLTVAGAAPSSGATIGTRKVVNYARMAETS